MRSSSSTTARRTGRSRLPSGTSISTMPIRRARAWRSSARRTRGSRSRATSGRRLQPSRSWRIRIPIACRTRTGSPSWSTSSCAAASSPSGARTSRRPSRASSRRRWPSRPADRRTCSSTTRWPSTSRAATWGSRRRRSRTSAASTPCSPPRATTSTSAGGSRTRATRSASARRRPSPLRGCLPFPLEWTAVGVLLFRAALVSPRTLVIAALPLMVSVGLAMAAATRARVDPRFSGPASRALIALLTYLGPLVRGVQRYLWRLRGLGQVGRISFEGEQQPPRIDYLRRGFTVGYWSEQGHEKEALLAALMDFFIPRKYLIAVDPGWNRWDLEIYRGVWSKAQLTVAAENHGGSKRLLNVRCEVRLTRVSQLSLLGFGAAGLGGLLFHLPEGTRV